MTDGIVIQTACLGRPFRLGMLYDCRSDKLIPGMTLWNDKMLKSALNTTPQVGSDFEVIAEDSLEEKASKLDISGSLKLSFMGGLIEVSGSAKYLDDRKTSKQQSRVSLKYWSTSHFEQLTMEQLGNVEYPDVFSKKIATHVVTGVLYGADAIFVFDRMVSENENVRNVNGQVEALIKCLPGMSSIKGEVSIKMDENKKQNASKIECKFHGDLQLKQNPTTFEDAVHVFQQLPELLKGESGPCVIPKKVWLYPLSSLDSAAAKLVRDISVSLVSQAQHVMEELLDYSMECNDLMKSQICSEFTGIRTQISKFKSMVLQYRTEFSKQLCQLLPAIREGGKEEALLADLFTSKESSPFSTHSVNQWLQQRRNDIGILDSQLKSFRKVKCIKLLSSASDLGAIVNDHEYEYVVCFSFQMLKGNDPLLEKMETFLSTTQIPPPKGEAELWSKDQSIMAGMRKHVSKFTKFAQVNENREKVIFIVADLSHERSEGGTTILLYHNGESTKFDPPSTPNDIKEVQTTQSTVSLEWTKPNECESVSHYTVEYCEEQKKSKNEWKSEKCNREFIQVCSLHPATSYCFRVRAECKAGVSEFMELKAPVCTRKSDRLAEIMLAMSVKEESKKGPTIYKVNGDEMPLSDTLHKVSIGQPRRDVKEKVLMVLGATGAGKSTLINGMINYIFGVQWKDRFRFKLISEIGTSQAVSQTSKITAYTIYCMDGSKIDYNLTIIDTPGFGDTSGLERDKQITKQIKDFFSVKGRNGISHLDGIGFVTQSALSRLTPTQQYIFDSILSIFGKNVAENIFVMVTFADGQYPPVMSAIEAANIPQSGFFKFNNSAIFADVTQEKSTNEDDEEEEDNFDQMFWKMGVSSFKKFFTTFKKAETVSLTMTKDVLQVRECLETNVMGLQGQMKACLGEMEVLRQERDILKKHENEIATNQNFSKPVKVPYYDTQKTAKDEFVTNCLRCSQTCHWSCAFSDDDDKKYCSAMDRNGDAAKCTVCDGCHWREHKNTGVRFILKYRMETRTLEDLKKKYKTALQGKQAVEDMLKISQTKLEDEHAKLHQMIEESQQCLKKLDEIALKPNPLTQVQYIELLINSEKQQAKEGWMERVQYLEDTKQQAELLALMKDANDVDRRIEEEERKGEQGWEKKVLTLQQVKRIKCEVENIQKQRQEAKQGLWGTIKAAGKAMLGLN